MDLDAVVASIRQRILSVENRLDRIESELAGIWQRPPANIAASAFNSTLDPIYKRLEELEKRFAKPTQVRERDRDSGG